jgi:hypothetical protein
MATCSFSEYADRIGKSPAYVSKLKKAGRLVIVKDEKGRDCVNIEATDRLIANTTDLGRANNGANARPARVEGADAAAPAAAPPDATRGRVDTIFRQAQAQERAFGAKKAELDYNRAIGRVVDRAATERGIFDAFRIQRDAVFAVCPSAAAKCVGNSDAREIERIFAAALRVAFAESERKLSALLPKQETGAAQ